MGSDVQEINITEDGSPEMNPQRLLQHFHRIAEAPDAVPRLRRFILDLAVRGKLVEQDRNDEPAAELLKRIWDEPDQVFLPIPENWASAKVGKLLKFQYGKALPAGDRSKQGRVRVFGSNGVVGYCEKALAEEPAIIVGRKGSAGALNLCDGPSWTTDVAYFLIPPAFFQIRFLLFALQRLDLGSLGKGVKPGLNRAEAYELSMAVPPLAEQHRIVAKVDELMALCDRLEAAQAERESRRDRVVAASLIRLNNGADAESFREHARFHLRHHSRLTTRPEHIQQLRQTILNLAVRGRLVPQDRRDESASILLNRLKVDAEAYCEEKGVAPPQPELINQEAVPHPAPPGWSWTRLCALCRVITDGDHQPPPKSEDGIAFLTIGNITTGRLDFSNCRFVSKGYLESVADYKKPSRGDILYTVVGATYGRPVFVDTDRQFCVQRHIAILKPASGIDVKFLCYMLASPLVYEQATLCTTGTAQPTIPLRPLRNFLVPLPPFAEQRRVVAKVDELMALCAQLETQLNTAQTDSRRLLGATLSEALAA